MTSSLLCKVAGFGVWGSGFGVRGLGLGLGLGSGLILVLLPVKAGSIKQAGQ